MLSPEYIITLFGKTQEGQNVYYWGLGKAHAHCLLKLYNKQGGCFLFTHQRDCGYILHYKRDTLPTSNRSFLLNGDIIDTYST